MYNSFGLLLHELDQAELGFRTPIIENIGLWPIVKSSRFKTILLSRCQSFAMKIP